MKINLRTSGNCKCELEESNGIPKPKIAPKNCAIRKDRIINNEYFLRYLTIFVPKNITDKYQQIWAW